MAETISAQPASSSPNSGCTPRNMPASAAMPASRSNTPRTLKTRKVQGQWWGFMGSDFRKGYHSKVGAVPSVRQRTKRAEALRVCCSCHAMAPSADHSSELRI